MYARTHMRSTYAPVNAASKMASYGYFASLAVELANTGIGVTLVCPGPVAAAVPPVSGSGTTSTPIRAVYGPQGLIRVPVDLRDKARMPAER